MTCFQKSIPYFPSTTTTERAEGSFGDYALTFVVENIAPRGLSAMSAANNQYLSNLLVEQTLTKAEVDALRGVRETIEGQLSVLQGSPRFYYGGSFGKRTMIKARYDLDLVMYWPNTATYSIKGIYDAV